MKTSANGLLLIKRFEGFKDVPYLDICGVPTIGYGFTHYADGRPVTMLDKPITEEQATAELQALLLSYEAGVNAMTQERVNSNQFDALIDFVYNLGLGSLKGSTLLRLVNSNPADAAIAIEFNKWIHAGGKVVPALVQRREFESKLYFSPVI